jgi:hypothetical protein
MLQHAIENGRGGCYLRLTPEQDRRLRQSRPDVARLSKLGDSGAGKFTVAVDQGDDHAAAYLASEGRLALNEQNSFVIKAVPAAGIIRFQLLEN